MFCLLPLFQFSLLNCFLHFSDDFFLVFLAFFKGFIDYVQVFACLFLDFFKGIFNFLFKGFYHLHKSDYKGFFSVSSMLGCSCLAVVELLDSGGAALLFMLLNVFLHWCLPISSFNQCKWYLASWDTV